MNRIGIDLGTTNTVAAQDGCACPAGEDGRPTLPR
jgi:molecular chaperone DnaK (HSP70)